MKNDPKDKKAPPPSPEINISDADAALFLRLLKNTAAGGKEPYDGIPNRAQTAALCELAGRQGVLPIIAHGIMEAHLTADQKTSDAWERVRDDSLMRYIVMDLLTEKMTAALDAHGIEYVLLKGAAIRALYPEPWMRLSSDIDILVHEEHLDEAVNVLCEECELEKKAREYHNVVLVKPNAALVELHFSIMEDNERMDGVLKTVWDHVERAPGTSECRMTPTFFLYHQIAHAAFHLGFSGCGIRPFLDMYLIRKQLAINEEELQTLCGASGLAQFEKESRMLCEYWFSDSTQTPSDTTKALEAYILGNCLFGSAAQRIASERGHKSKAGFILDRLFVKRSVLEQQYPKLRNRPYLLPYYQVKRMADALFKRGKLGSFMGEIKETGAVDEKLIASETAIRQMLGLHDAK